MKNKKYSTKTLVASATALSLGLTGIGGTTSVFAAENDKTDIPQQNAVQQKITGHYYSNGTMTLKDIDLWVQNFQKQSGASDWENTLNVIEQSLPTIYNDLNSGNFSNTFRILTMLGTSIIPFGGAFISPIIGLLWPESGLQNIQQMLKDMEEKLGKVMDEKIQAKDLEDINSEIVGMNKNLKEFENSLNNKISYRSQGDVDELNRSRISSIQSNFNRIIEIARKGENAKIAELPLFTVIATAHLTFLHVVKKNGTSSKINYTEAALKDFLQSMKKNQEDYKNHIDKTYKEAEAKINESLDSLGNKEGLQGEINQLNNEIENLTDQLNRLANTQVYQIMELTDKINAKESERNRLQEKVNKINDLVQQKNDFYEKTQGNKAFRLITDF